VVEDRELPLDRLTRPVLARTARVALAATALPAVGLYLAGQRLAGALQTRAAAGMAAPALPPPLAHPPGSAEAAYERVLAVPERSRHRGRAAIVLQGLHDWPLMLITAKPDFALAGFRYPRPFRHRVLPGADGEPIAAMVALRPAAPAVLVVHGAMTTKGFDYIRRVSVRLWRAGFSVVAVDLRGFGATAIASIAPTSLGFKEGEDLAALDGWLRAAGAASVGALGFSLGGAAVLNAARVASERGSGLDGGVLALSPPADLREALAHVSRRPPAGDPFFATWLTLRAAATARARAHGARVEALSPAEAAELAIPAYYGVSAAEAAERSSPERFVAQLRVPVLILHAEDDIVVPVAHARRLLEAAAGNESVRVLILPWGGHTAFESVDPEWMDGVELAWFGTLRRE
jgi:pimeloyl-ACP methyl ester carboxylesterase